MIENFEKLPFERKVDILVARYVFEWKDIKIEWREGDERYPGYWACYRVEGIGIYTNIPLYSVLLTSAWDIIRKFEYMYLYRANFINDGRWECKLRDDRGVLIIGDEGTGGKYYGWAETEMLAICYAGLKAVGFDVKKFLKEEGKA